MADLVSASRLAQLMDEIVEGLWTTSGQLSLISEACLGWAMESPEDFRAAYDRFERARQVLRINPTLEDFVEFRLSAQELGNIFQAAV